MNEEFITLPRSLVAALVVPTGSGFAQYLCAQEGRPMRCSYCEAEYEACANLDGYAHVVDCPVRQVQEVLAKTSAHPLYIFDLISQLLPFEITVITLYCADKT